MWLSLRVSQACSRNPGRFSSQRTDGDFRAGVASLRLWVEVRPFQAYGTARQLTPSCQRVVNLRVTHRSTSVVMSRYSPVPHSVRITGSAAVVLPCLSAYGRRTHKRSAKPFSLITNIQHWTAEFDSRTVVSASPTIHTLRASAYRQHWTSALARSHQLMVNCAANHP